MTQTGTPTVTFEERCAAARSLGPGFGDGWLSNNAADLIRIAAFAGFDAKEVALRVAMSTAKNKGEKVNTRSVERVLGEMSAEHKAAHPEAYK